MHEQQQPPGRPGGAAAPAGEPAAGSSPDDSEQSLRHRFRQFFRRNRALDLTYRVVVGVLGAAITLGGLALIPLPGPGWLIVFAGLALLASEFRWAQRVLDFARDKVHAWTEWVKRQSIMVRAALALGTLLVVAAAVGAFLYVRGVPDWLPLIG